MVLLPLALIVDLAIFISCMSEEDVVLKGLGVE